MLNKEILDAVAGYAQSMQEPVTIVLQTGNHPKRDELKQFLSAIAGVSDKIRLEQRDLPGSLRSPISFLLEQDDKDTGIRFSGIPGGHEFNSLILALLQASGAAMKLDQSIQSLIKAMEENLHFEVYISLSCHNCPEVVQTLNQFALLNPRISTEMIDGGLFQELVADKDIQGVPSVYLNGELFGNGKVDAAQLIDKLITRNPGISQPATQHSIPLQDVTVIGGGPAGISAAIYSARKGLKVTVITDRLGGQVKDTMGIENLISVPKTTGPELADALRTHLEAYDITLREHARVTSIEGKETRTVTLSTGETLDTRTVIVATGARWRELGVPGEKEYIGNGVAYCPHCDGPFFKGRDVAVVGGGNSGIEAALDLSGIVKSVTVLEFGSELKADKVLVDQVKARDNISILKNVATREITAADGKVNGITYQDRSSGKLTTQELAGVFVQIGLVPNSQFVRELVELNQFGEIVVDDKCRTSATGIFACGDVTTVPYKQIVISMGEGSKAALTAFEHLLTNSSESIGVERAA